MKTQTQTSLLIIGDKEPILRTAPYGEIFKKAGKLLMRVKPTQFLLNSTLVADVLNRGDAFVINVETGTLYIMQGDEEIAFVDATLLINE